MAIYLLFIQHVIYSLKPNGKAAIVVPTGFLTARAKIEKKIRQKLIDEKMLKGVISMPSNIFANTGTNVSVIFIDKGNTEGDVILIDASKLGTKVKEGKNQRTVLSDDEVNKIINTFTKHETKEDFSVVVSYDQIVEKNYSFSAGQYFDIKVEYTKLSAKEFEDVIENYNNELNKLFKENNVLGNDIIQSLKRLHYEK